MMRYLRRLADFDIALDRSMIPLGSCDEAQRGSGDGRHHLARVRRHPSVRTARAADGYVTLIRSLEQWLAELTGYDAVSLQPNAGSQGSSPACSCSCLPSGERRVNDVCLIPSSAHGTNAASAVMAGMRVVVVACRDNGDVDVDDLRAKIEPIATAWPS